MTNDEIPNDEDSSAPAEPEESVEDSDLSQMLWNMSLKYKRLLAKDEVVETHESEDDRQVVEPAGEHLATATEWSLDGRIYRSFAEMQSRRDAKMLLSTTTPLTRLRQLALQVAIRVTPVVFVAPRLSMNVEGFTAPTAVSSDDLITGEEEELPLEPAIDDELDEQVIHLTDLSEEELNEIQHRISTRFEGQTLSRDDLGSGLSSSEADLLSQMARKRELAIQVKEDGSITLSHDEPAGEALPVVVLLEPHSKAKETQE